MEISQKLRFGTILRYKKLLSFTCLLETVYAFIFFFFFFFFYLLLDINYGHIKATSNTKLTERYN